ncbi:glycine zipper domain-containing protein [Roseimicrobium sp. ORNL1]|uniref:glycine zipper domain-containing protein n=1 Tax=Roseimicrobium sp. ORNL1 TaxID=2711231 RepID=UPI0013E131F7|nr:glycine zipper domain-containing protein [Roseimicrobium sp. ORNL1]QIF04153.1 hypothetical protein G5S37_22365 [Roseimicrobium sp. ORNL1]
MKLPARLAAVGSLAAASLLSSCVYPYPYVGPNEARGSVIGAATGAIAGGIIGNQSCSGLEGALIGGALGSLAGAAIGNAQDNSFYGPPPPPGYYYGPRPVPRLYGGYSYYGGPGCYNSCPPRYYARRYGCW